MIEKTESQAKLKIGIVGMSEATSGKIRSSLLSLPLQIEAVCDDSDDLSSDARTRRLSPRRYRDPHEMFRTEALDAVLIFNSALPFSHVVCDALDAGLHVWVQPPLATRASEIESILRRRRDRVVVVGYSRLFMRATRAVTQIFESQEASSPLMGILAEYPLLLPLDGESLLNSTAVSIFLREVSNPLSLCLKLGGTVAAVTLHRVAQEGGVCIIEFVNGAFATLHMPGIKSDRVIEHYRLSSNNAYVTIEGGVRVTCQSSVGVSAESQYPGLPGGTCTWELGNDLEGASDDEDVAWGTSWGLGHFCEQVLAESAEAPSLELALNLMKVYEAALLSDGQRMVIS